MNPKAIKDLLRDVRAHLAAQVEGLEAEYDISDDGADYDRLQDVKALLARVDRQYTIAEVECQTYEQSRHNTPPLPRAQTSC